MGERNGVPDIGNSRCKYPAVGECGSAEEWKEKLGLWHYDSEKGQISGWGLKRR